jgi:hypothetical protein
MLFKGNPVQLKIDSVVKSYLMTGKLLHLISLLEIILILMVTPAIKQIETEGNSGLLFIKICLLLFLFSLPVLSQLDARSRFQNYKKIKDQLYHYGFQPRLLKPFINSRCQRDAAQNAANELRLGDIVITHFHSHGYRWYHIFPDFIFEKPWFLASKYFWLTTFFVPYYPSKFDFLNPESKSANKFPAINPD